MKKLFWKILLWLNPGFKAWLRLQKWTIFGPPTVGKTTLATSIGAKIGSSVFDFGHIMREKRNAKYGDLNQGELTNSEIFLELVAKKLAASPTPGAIYSGSPRKVAEVNEFVIRDWLNLAVVLEADREQLFARRQSRIKAAQSRGEAPRPDDQPGVLENRIDVYNQETLLAIETLRGWKLPVMMIDANQSRRRVENSVFKALYEIYSIYQSNQDAVGES